MVPGKFRFTVFIRRDEGFTNLFQNSQVEDLSEHPWNKAPPESSSTRNTQTQSTQVELQEDQQDDHQFALYALLADFREVRALVRKTW